MKNLPVCSRWLYIVGLLLVSYANVLGVGPTVPLYKKKVVEKVLEELYSAASFPKVQRPKIDVVRSDYFGAVFTPSKNVIQIEDKLYAICTSFNSDSLSALAFIISHELSHVIQKHAKPVAGPANFLQNNFERKKNNRDELAADIQGTFICYLAGYNPARVLNRLMDSIYISYNLDHSKVTDYPTKSERQRSADSVLILSEKLTHLFEAGNLLLLYQEYDLAEISYRNILTIYQGCEIYNNLGLCYTLKAMEYMDVETDQYSYPFEMDVNTRLRKITKFQREGIATKPRGELTAEDRLARQYELRLAQQQFKLALQINPDYISAHTHIISCMNLSGKPEEAIEYAKNLRQIPTRQIKNNRDWEWLNLAVGISYALLKKDHSINVFNTLRRSTNISVSVQSQYNKEIFQSGKCSVEIQSSCTLSTYTHDFKSEDLFISKSLGSSLDVYQDGVHYFFTVQVNQDFKKFTFSTDLGPVVNVYTRTFSENRPLLPVNRDVYNNDRIRMVRAKNGHYMGCTGSPWIFFIDARGFQKEVIFINRY